MVIILQVPNIGGKINALTQRVFLHTIMLSAALPGVTTFKHEFDPDGHQSCPVPPAVLYIRNRLVYSCIPVLNVGAYPIRFVLMLCL